MDSKEIFKIEKEVGPIKILNEIENIFGIIILVVYIQLKNKQLVFRLTTYDCEARTFCLTEGNLFYFRPKNRSPICNQLKQGKNGNWYFLRKDSTSSKIEILPPLQTMITTRLLKEKND